LSASAQDNFIRSDAPDPILDLRGKAILKEGDEAILGQLNATAVDVARAMESEVVPADIRLLLDELVLYLSRSDPCGPRQYDLIVMLAYRFLPLDDHGKPRAGSRYTMTTETELDVGDRVSFDVLGHKTWEVVKRDPGTRVGRLALLGVTDAAGNDLPLAGTLHCRGLD
jgi:hypothetical protein